MSIETADKDLQAGIESGAIDPVELEQMVRDTNMAEPAKQTLIAKIRSAEPTPAAEPVQEQPSVTMSPVSPLANTQQRSFFLDENAGVDFFDSPAASKVNKPVPEVKAAELGFATAVLTGADENDMADISETVKNDLLVTGESPLIYRLEESRAEEDKDTSWKGHWTNKSFLQFATEDPAQAQEMLKQAELERAELKTTERRARLITDTVQRLTPEQKEVFNDFSFVLSETLYQQSLEQTMSRKIQDDTANASLWNWASVLVAPLTAVSSRTDQAKLLDKIGEAIGSDPESYVFKSDHGKIVQDYLLDPKITVQEALSRLDEVESVMNSMDYDDLGVNPLHAAELYEVIRSQLREKDSRMTMGTLYDVADATVLGVEAVSIGKLLAKAGNAVAVRVFGQLGAASKAVTPEHLASIEKMIAEATAVSTAPVQPSVAISNRGSTLDMLAAQNPEAARSITSNVVSNEPEAITSLGVTPDNIAERIVPTPEEGLGLHQAVLSGSTSTTERIVREFQKELQDLNVSDLLTNAELEKAPDVWAESVTSRTNGTMFSTHSELVRQEDTGDLVLRGVFGATVDSGFDSFSKAERFIQTMFDSQGKIKVRKKGSIEPLRYWDEASKDPSMFRGDHKLEFFVEAENTLKPNASFANPFDADYISPMVQGASYLQSWSRMLQKDLTDSISAYVDKSTRLASLQKQLLDPVLKMNNGKDKDAWTKMLMHGDENEVVFSSKAEANRVLNTEVSDKAWDAYVGTRAYYDSVADVRQRSVFKHLDQNGYKTVYGNTGALTDLNGQLHVRPFTDKPSISGRPADGADELFAPSSVWGDEIFDVTTGEVRKLDQELLDEVYSGNKIIARTSRESEFRKGELYDFVIINPQDVKPLSRRPMNIRTGHVDVNYKGQDSWVAQKVGGYKGGTSVKLREVGTKRLNGADVPRETTIGLYANLRQANKAREELIQDAIEKLGPNATESQIKELSVRYPAPVLTREGENELGIDMSGTFGGLPAHARKRGERVLGPNGQAEILSLEESLTRSVGEVRRALAIDAVEVQKRRFAQTYAKHMDGYTGFESDFSRFTFKESAKASGVYLEAQRAHTWIQNLDHAVSNREFSLFMHHVEAYAADLINSGSRWKQEFGEILRDVSQAKLDTELKKLTATLLIGTRVLYQSLANTAQAVNLFIHNPAVFAADTIRRTLASVIGIAGLKVDSRVMQVLGAKMSGMTPDQFKLHLDNLKKSGIIRSAATQDVAALLGETGKIEAGRHYAGASTFWKRMVPGLGAGDRVGKALMFPQHVATDIANMFAYNHAFSVLAKSKGIDTALARRSQITVAGDTRRLTFNQNRVDQFAYQQNAASMQLMFFQHVHRMYNDLILDPMLRVGTGNRLKISKDGTNPYATSYATSLKTFGLMSALWGAGAYPIVDAAKNSLSDQMSQDGYTSEMLSWFFDGLVSKGLESAVGMKFDPQSRLTPAGALQTTFDMMFTNDGGLTLGGPVTHLGTVVDKVAKIGQAYWSAEPMDKEVWSKLALSVASSATSGTNDAFRATIAANMLEYVDSSGKPLVQVTDMAWLPIAFSIPPDAIDTVYESKAALANAEDKAFGIAKLANRTAMADLGDQPNHTADQIVEAVRLGLRSCELMAGNNPVLAQLAKEKFLKQQVFGSDGILTEHADKLIRVLEPDKAVQEIQKLQQADPNNKTVYQFLIDSLRYDGNVQ